MQHHKCRQGLREEATSCTGRKEKATDPGQGTRKPTPTHIPFPTRFSKRRHARRLNRALVVHTPLRIKWQQPRQIMPPITRIYEASVALSSRLSDLGSWKPAAMNRGWDRIKSRAAIAAKDTRSKSLFAKKKKKWLAFLAQSYC